MTNWRAVCLNLMEIMTVVTRWRLQLLYADIHTASIQRNYFSSIIFLHFNFGLEFTFDRVCLQCWVVTSTLRFHNSVVYLVLGLASKLRRCFLLDSIKAGLATSQWDQTRTFWDQTMLDTTGGLALLSESSSSCSRSLPQKFLTAQPRMNTRHTARSSLALRLPLKTRRQKRLKTMTQTV